MTVNPSSVLNDLVVSAEVSDFVSEELLPGLDIDESIYWANFESILAKYVAKNQNLLAKRASLQKQVREWTLKKKADEYASGYTKEFVDFLRKIEYLVPEAEDFQVTTANVDKEITQTCAPQLVVPINNARYAINAVNARWGSLFDALYFSDAIPFEKDSEGKVVKPVVTSLDENRVTKTVAWMDDLLDCSIPLVDFKHSQVKSYSISAEHKLVITTTDGKEASLANNDSFIGYCNEKNSIVFKHNGLHLQLITDSESMVGKCHHAGLKDIILEAAASIILDCEDSVSAVDAQDKVVCYRNWTGIQKGNLQIEFTKKGKKVTRTINKDVVFTNGKENIVLKARALCFVRNVGIHMYSNACTYKGQDVPEGILDAYITATAAIHDLKKDSNNSVRNSLKGSIYIVKPKMHGPEEVQFTCDLFASVEDALKLDRNTIKVGIMDEERRTTVNLKECIRVAKERVVFINTGFLDRVGDEISTIMETGPVHPKAAIKQQKWIKNYENWNIDIGLETGLPGHALIGKGMWDAPDRMNDMLTKKIGHLQAGASVAWVPSPTAATLHATHYHRLSVSDVQNEFKKNRKRVDVSELLTPEPWDFKKETAQVITDELRDNVQGLLGYVIRWVNMGVGCSKVPNLQNIGLMEDRATLRISSQIVANWLHHNVVTKEQVKSLMQELSVVVDEQNSKDPLYVGYNIDGGKLQDSAAYQAAELLIFHGAEELNGYTEPALNAKRLKFKSE